MQARKGIALFLGATALACGGSGPAAKAVAAEGSNSDGGRREQAAAAGPSAAGGASAVSHACGTSTFTCKASGKLPAGAPQLTKGQWVNISPKDVPWGKGFTQGMALDPCDPATMYLTVCGFDPVGVKAGLYKTTDGGSNWKKLSELDEPLYVRIDPNNPQHLYAVDGVRGGSEGFWVSCDGGETFRTPEGFKALKDDPGMFQYDVYDIAVDPTNFDHVLLSHHGAWGWTDTKWDTNSGVLESKDGGETWIVHEPMKGWGTGHAIAFLYNPELKLGNGDTWLLGTQGAGMFKTSDAGKTWRKVTNVVIQHGGGSVYYDKTGVLYASGASTNLRSADNGDTWTQVGNSKGYNAVYGDGTLLYTAPGFGPTTFFTAPEGGDGMTWTPLGTQQFDSGPFEMAVDRKNGILYSANWGAGLWALKL